MSTFHVCTATAAHLDDIMRIEYASFAPHICERRAVFAERITVFPKGFFVLCNDDSSCGGNDGSNNGGTNNGAACDTACAHGNDTRGEDTCQTKNNRGILGYCSCELWQPPKNDSFGYADFALNHSIGSRHDANGTVLYVSSLAVSSECRAKGAGSALFSFAVESLCARYAHINRIVLLVCRSWRGAHHIYVKNGFRETGVLANFFAPASLETTASPTGLTLPKTPTPTERLTPPETTAPLSATVRSTTFAERRASYTKHTECAEQAESTECSARTERMKRAAGANCNSGNTGTFIEETARFTEQSRGTTNKSQHSAEQGGDYDGIIMEKYL